MQNLLEYIPGANPLQIGDHIYYTAQDFIELDLPERGHLLSPWLPEQAISMVYAPSGCRQDILCPEPSSCYCYRRRVSWLESR